MGGEGGEGGERGASKNELEAFSCTFCPKCWSFEHSQSEKTYRSCLKTKNACTKSVPRMGDPFPLSVYLGRQNVIHVIKWTRPSPSSLHTVCKPSKTGQWEGLGMRLVKCTLGECAPIKIIAFFCFFFFVFFFVFFCLPPRSKFGTGSSMEHKPGKVL